MDSKRFSKLDRWRAKFGVLAIALSCLLTAINSWGQNWILTSVLSLGALVCGIIGFFDMKRTNEKEHTS
ncbi:hypothetical protein ATG70_0430 [Bacillus sp. es.036]|nr:hypothetical protein ATG70_0430 [Bacillus sp. es.036]